MTEDELIAPARQLLDELREQPAPGSTDALEAWVNDYERAFNKTGKLIHQHKAAAYRIRIMEVQTRQLISNQPFS